MIGSITRGHSPVTATPQLTGAASYMIMCETGSDITTEQWFYRSTNILQEGRFGIYLKNSKWYFENAAFKDDVEGIWSCPASANSKEIFCVTHTYQQEATPPSMYRNGSSQTVTQEQAPVNLAYPPGLGDIFFAQATTATFPWLGKAGAFYIWDSILSSAEIITSGTSKRIRAGMLLPTKPVFATFLNSMAPGQSVNGITIKCEVGDGITAGGDWSYGADATGWAQ